MKKGLYIIASDNYISVVWEKIVKVLSAQETVWTVDCLDSLYETDLMEGVQSTDRLLSALQDNAYIFSARMIGCSNGQQLNRAIICSDDYYSSNCESVVLCADAIHFEVFSKSDDLLQKLSHSLTKNDVKSIVWLDDSLGGRCEFTV